MPTITITKIYDLVSIKLGRETAENLTTFIEEKIKGELDTKTSILATKEDLARERADMIKWMFLFWIGQAATTFGLILLFLKK
jgi:hypothetical protein